MELKNGDHVMFMDTKRRERHALVTFVHDGGLGIEVHKEKYGSYPCINLVAVMLEDDRKDPYGQQIEHASSVQHESPSVAVAGGYFYKMT